MNHVLRMGVYSTSKTTTSRRVIILSSRACVSSFSASRFGLKSAAALSWIPFCYLEDWLINRVVILRKLPFRGCLTVCLAVRWGLGFQHEEAPAHYGEDVRRCWNVIYWGMWIGTLRSPYLTLVDFFAVGTLKGALICNSSEAVARRQVAVTAVDASMLRRVRKNVMQRLLWNGRRPPKTPVISMRRSWFDQLIVAPFDGDCISWNLDVTGRALYNACRLL